MIKKIINEEIFTVMENRTKEFAKSAIRDIFYQFSSRGIPIETWKGLSESVSGYFGEENYKNAIKELVEDGYLSFTKSRVEWIKMIGPIHEAGDGMELAFAEYAPKNWQFIPPNQEKIPVDKSEFEIHDKINKIRKLIRKAIQEELIGICKNQ